MGRLTHRGKKRNTQLPLFNVELAVKWEERLAAYEDTNLAPSEILALKAEVERLREERRWIPVTERLPEIGKCVLLRHTYNAFIGEHGEYEGITIGYLHRPTDRRYKPYFYYVAVSDYGDMVRAESICPGSEYVTHWMKMPEPQKGEAE